jgi:hypothetical protein
MVNDHLVACFRYKELRTLVNRTRPIPDKKVSKLRGFLKGVNTQFERE